MVLIYDEKCPICRFTKRMVEIFGKGRIKTVEFSRGVEILKELGKTPELKLYFISDGKVYESESAAYEVAKVLGLKPAKIFFYLYPTLKRFADIFRKCQCE